MWDASKCNLCGECLERCEYINYDKDKAVAEIKLLTEGKEAGVLGKCITCFACDSYCPTGANPFNLIAQMQEKTGATPLKEAGKPFLGMINGMSSELVPGDPDKPVLSLCFMEKLLPEGAIGGQMFAGMPVAKGADYFCWFGQLHAADLTGIKENASKFINTMSGLQKDIVFLHDDCYAMVDYMVKELGITVPFRYMHIYEYLRNYLRDHRSSISKLGKKIAFQRPCASRYTPEKDVFLDEIFSLIGAERAARKYDRDDALCCGAAAAPVFPELTTEIRTKNINDAIASGCDALITVCPACEMSLHETAEQLGLKTLYLTYLCRIALGEAPWPA
jgi:Fe-S oxidoreductase